MKDEGVRVTSDLTVNQRNQIQHYRDQGLHAYYKNDRIRVEQRQGQPQSNRGYGDTRQLNNNNRGYMNDRYDENRNNNEYRRSQ
jgi:hypothetical protein